VEAAEQRAAAANLELASAQSRVGQGEAVLQAKLAASAQAAEEAAAQASAVATRLRDVEERERAVRAAQDELAQARAELGTRAAEARGRGVGWRLRGSAQGRLLPVVRLSHSSATPCTLTVACPTNTQVEAQSALIRRAEQQLADVEGERRKLAARAAELAVTEDDARARGAALDRREAELAGEASR
jgi:hypothetical protein